MVQFFFFKLTNQIVIFSQIKDIQNIPKKLYIESCYCIKLFFGLGLGLGLCLES